MAVKSIICTKFFWTLRTEIKAHDCLVRAELEVQELKLSLHLPSRESSISCPSCFRGILPSKELDSALKACALHAAAGSVRSLPHSSSSVRNPCLHCSSMATSL